MTEPEVASSDPTQLRTAAVLDGDEWVINGHKWFTTGANRAAYTTVMCRTEDESVSPYLAFSMIIVPTDTPGVHDRPRDAGARDPGRPLRGALRRRAGSGGQPARAARPRVRDRPGAARPRPDLPLHAVARPGAAGVRAAVRPAQQPHCVRRAARQEAVDAAPRVRVLRRDPVVPAADPPRRRRDRPGRAGPGRDRHDQGRRCPDAPQRDRPGDPGLRRRRAHRRHAAVATCTGRRGSAGSTTDPTRCTSTPSPGASSRSSGTAPESTSPDRRDLPTDGDDRTSPHQSLRHRHRSAGARRGAVRGQHRPLVVDHQRSQRRIRGGDHPSCHGGRGGRDRSRGHRPGGACQAGPVGHVPLPPLAGRRTGPDRGRGGAVGSVGHQSLGPADPERPAHGGRTRRGGRTATDGCGVRRRSGVRIVARRAAAPPDRRCATTDRSRSQRSHALALRPAVGVRRPAVPPEPGPGSDGPLWGLAVAGRAGGARRRDSPVPR